MTLRNVPRRTAFRRDDGVTSIIREAKTSIVVIDGYIGERTLQLLSVKAPNANAQILTGPVKLQCLPCASVRGSVRKDARDSHQHCVSRSICRRRRLALLSLRNGATFERLVPRLLTLRRVTWLSWLTNPSVKRVVLNNIDVVLLKRPR